MATRLTAIIVSAIVTATLVAGWIVGAQREDNNGPIDLLILNGVVYPADGTGQLAEAVAIRGNTILRIGTNRDLKRLRRPGTVVLDAHGGTVLPGFNDAHVHLLEGALRLDDADLREAVTVADIQYIVRVVAGAHPDRLWILGRGWRAQAFPGGHPTRQQLDTIVPDRPAFLISSDGRTGWANSRALALAGITRKTRNPKNGTIVKDAKTGEPTGLLKDSAERLVEQVVPGPTREDRLAALGAAISEAHRLGVTSIQNIVSAEDEIDLYDELQRSGDLKLRVASALTLHPEFTESDRDRVDRIRKHYENDSLFRVATARIVVDAMSPSRAPAGRPVDSRDETSAPVAASGRYAPEDLARIAMMMDQHDWQIAMEAGNARAVRMAFDVYERMAAARPATSTKRRHRIELGRAIDPNERPRFALLDLIASVHPLHLEAVGTSIEERKVAREERSDAISSFDIRQAGGRLALGSDWPASTFDPRVHINTIVNGGLPDPQPARDETPVDRLSLMAAIDAYTSGAAYASNEETRKGTLAKGMLADLVILSSNIFDAPAARLLDALVDTTIFDGKVVFTREAKTTN